MCVCLTYCLFLCALVHWLVPQEVDGEHHMAGLTLDQYISRLVTTPASLAATSGEGERVVLIGRCTMSILVQ
jgi:hypothetical protein